MASHLPPSRLASRLLSLLALLSRAAGFTAQVASHLQTPHLPAVSEALLPHAIRFRALEQRRVESDDIVPQATATATYEPWSAAVRRVKLEGKPNSLLLAGGLLMIGAGLMVRCLLTACSSPDRRAV